MSKVIAIGVALSVVLLGVPILALAVISTGTTAAAQCQRHQEDVGTAADSRRLSDLVVDGPVGGSVHGKLGVAAANIPNRSGLSGFRASMPRVLSTNPDFVALNEVGHRSLGQIEAAAPGYSAYRDRRMPRGTKGIQSTQARGDVVLWKRDTWTRHDGGRVRIVGEDKAFYQGRPVEWANFATWALLERRNDGAVVSIISVHHMINPRRFPRQHGAPSLTRRQQYARGMDMLVRLTNSLAAHGPVLVAGDMNSRAEYADLDWSAVAKMKAAGYGWYNHAVDFVFFPRDKGVRLDRGWTGRMVSDHRWVAVRLTMNGAGPTGSRPKITGVPALAVGNDPVEAVPRPDVHAQLMKLRLGPEYPTLTSEQANHAMAVARVARDLGVPRRGLEIAIATAIQESKLENLAGGDRDSGGLFQQRPSAGWGRRAQVTDPTLAALAFFGRAKHTGNPGLLDVPGWEQMSAGQAVASFHNPGTLYEDYDQWQPIAKEMAGMLGANLRAAGPTTFVSDESCIPSGACATGASRYNLGPVKPQLANLVNILGPMFDIETVGGHRQSAVDADGHPAGLAADFMVPLTPAGKAQGDALVAHARAHARELGIDYIIWRQRIWSLARADEGWRPMRDRGSPTANHLDHPHINVLPNVPGAGLGVPGQASSCGEVVYPVPARYVGNDARNWHESGGRWSTWHSGTDFAARCGTPVSAAHAGTIEVDTTAGWSGPWLVKVTSGPASLTTWYAHMQKVTVARGETVQPGQPIGEVGDEGNSSGCHLHFEVHLKNGSIYGPDNVDPSQWLADNARQREEAGGW